MERILLLIAVIAMGLLIFFAAKNPPTPQGGSPLPEMPDSPPGDEWFREMVVNNPRPVVVDFNAAWCGPCRRLEPLLKDLEEEFSGQLDVVKVDVGERPHLARHYNAEAIPMLLVMHRGEVLDGTVGLVDYAALKKLVTPHLHRAPAEIGLVE